LPPLRVSLSRLRLGWKKSFQGLEKSDGFLPDIGKFGTDFSKVWKKYLAPGRGGRRPGRYRGCLSEASASSGGEETPKG
jgi:hypothetical protein